MIFDSHCHLNDKALYDNIDEHIKSANEMGVTDFLVIGWNLENSILAVKIAQKYEHCYAAVGFHPTEITNYTDYELNELEKLLKEDKVVALGEIGLDYFWVKDIEERNKQKEWFIKQIKLANKYNLPIVVHNRESNQDCIEILKNNRPIKEGVMHCYSGSVEMLKDVFDCNLVISLGGPVTFKNAKTPKEVAKNVPLDKLLVETDSPYLTPHPYRGTLNSPKYTALVVEEIANLRGVDKKVIEDITYQNTKRIFFHE